MEGCGGRREEGPAGAGLPHELHSAVRRAAAAPGLGPRGREEVESELTAHLEDGLADGWSPAELLAAFGDPDRAARLIGRARRPVRSRIRALLPAAGAAAALAGALWVGVAAGLRLGEPARRTSADGLRDLAAVRSLARRAGALLAEADAAAAAGRRDAAAARGRAFRVLDSLGTHPSPAARLEAEALLPGAAGGLDLAALERWLDDYLARVYAGEAGGGRLTAAGLRVARAFKGSLDPPLRARLLEPVYFALPADGPETRRRAAGLLALAREVRARPLEPAPMEAFEAELARLRAGPGPLGARFDPLALVMDRLRAALRAERAVLRRNAAPGAS